jgi:hypothetical protein
MVVIYHRFTPLPKVRKGLDGYRAFDLPRLDHRHAVLESEHPTGEGGATGRETLHPGMRRRVGL